MEGNAEIKPVGNESPQPRRGRDPLQLLKDGYELVPEHEKVQGHPTKMCFEMLLKAPDEMLTVVQTTLRACYEANLPPRLSTAPGKSLFLSAYNVYCEERKSTNNVTPKEEEKLSEVQVAEAKKDALQTWMETNELLNKMVMLLFSKANEHLKAGSA